MPKHDDDKITVSVIPPTVDAPGPSATMRVDQALEILCREEGKEHTIAVLLGWLMHLNSQNTKEG
jgi:hypothetical protein